MNSSNLNESATAGFGRPASAGSPPSELRRWYFSVEDFDDNLEYIGPDGENIDEDAAKRHPFIGDHAAAQDEADRRADRWEQREAAFPARVTSHSLGKVVND